MWLQVRQQGVTCATFLFAFSVSLFKDVCCFLQRRRNSMFSLIMLG